MFVLMINLMEFVYFLRVLLQVSFSTCSFVSLL